MDTTNIPVWAKALATAFIGGFAGAAYDVLVLQQGAAVIDYRKALHVGLLGGIIAVVAYLKPAPKQVVPVLLAGFLLFSTVLVVGCGPDKPRKLAKLGFDINLGINTAARTIIDLKNQNTIYKDDASGYKDLLKLIDTVQTDADTLNKSLDEIVLLDATNKDAVLAHIDKLATRLVEAKAVGAHKLPPHVLAYITTGQALLNGARLVVASIKPGKPKELRRLKYKPELVLN